MHFWWQFYRAFQWYIVCFHTFSGCWYTEGSVWILLPKNLSGHHCSLLWGMDGHLLGKLLFIQIHFGVLCSSYCLTAPSGFSDHLGIKQTCVNYGPLHCVEKWFVLCNPWKFYTFIKIRLNCSIKVSNFGGPNKNIKFPLFLCILKFLRTVGDLNLDEFQEAWWGFVNSMKI